MYVSMISVVWIYAHFQIATGQTRADAEEPVFTSDFEARLFSDSSTLHHPGNMLSLWLALDPQMNADKQVILENNLATFCEKLQAKRPKFKSDVYFLWFVFNKVHADFLDFYNTNPPFYQIFSKKHNYNCVSGTALYSWVFEKLGYSTSIRETGDHVYLILQASDRQVLIESTDPTHGFVSGKLLIEKQEKIYAGKSISRNISLINLCGLQYFNQAVMHFYAKEYVTSKMFLEKGKKLYPDSGKIWRLSHKIKEIEKTELALKEKKPVKIVAKQVE